MKLTGTFMSCYYFPLLLSALALTAHAQFETGVRSSQTTFFSVCNAYASQIAFDAEFICIACLFAFSNITHNYFAFPHTHDAHTNIPSFSILSGFSLLQNSLRMSASRNQSTLRRCAAERQRASMKQLASHALVSLATLRLQMKLWLTVLTSMSAPAALLDAILPTDFVLIGILKSSLNVAAMQATLARTTVVPAAFVISCTLAVPTTGVAAAELTVTHFQMTVTDAFVRKDSLAMGSRVPMHQLKTTLVIMSRLLSLLQVQTPALL